MPRIGARALADQLRWERTGPAYRELAAGLRLLIMDGRVGLDVTLPGERELAAAAGVSRTTVAAAYRLLRDDGYLTVRRGARPLTSVPGSHSRAVDMVLDGRSELLDLAYATLEAPAELHHAYARALADLPQHLPGHGYHAQGVPDLRAVLAEQYTHRGLPTAPEELMITSGVQAALHLVFSRMRRPGARMLVENPTYPHALDLVDRLGIRLVRAAVTECGWDREALRTGLTSRPDVAYLIPDFHAPTGQLMDAQTRGWTARLLRRAGTLPVVDETMVELALDEPAPEPFAVHHPGAVTVGSTSKSFWGGLRIGWIRARRDVIDRLVAYRPATDLGTPVLEQLATAHLIASAATIARRRVAVLRSRRAVLLAQAAESLPTWRLTPGQGGLAVWAELPRPMSSALTAVAPQVGVRLAAGPRFGAGGTFESRLRLPFTLREPDLREAVRRLAAAQALLPHRPGRPTDQNPALA